MCVYGVHSNGTTQTANGLESGRQLAPFPDSDNVATESHADELNFSLRFSITSASETIPTGLSSRSALSKILTFRTHHQHNTWNLGKSIQCLTSDLLPEEDIPDEWTIQTHKMKSPEESRVPEIRLFRFVYAQFFQSWAPPSKNRRRHLSLERFSHLQPRSIGLGLFSVDRSFRRRV